MWRRGVDNEVREECSVVNGDVGKEERREQGEGKEVVKMDVEEKTPSDEMESRKGRERKRREGKGREGKGREGKGRE